MKNLILTSVILAAVLVIMPFSGCKTNPPVTPPDPVLVYGKVFITANVDGAEIYVDNQNTGRFTPDTVTALAGVRQIKLVKEGYLSATENVEVIEDQLSTLQMELQQSSSVPKQVLLEDFANVSCVPCVTSNLITHSLAGYYGSKLHIVKFPTNFPKATDPFYLAARPDCNSRMSYYNIIVAPTIIIDGTTRPVSSDSNAIKLAIENALLNEPRFNLSVTQSISGDNLILSVNVIPLNTEGLSASDLRLYTAVVEKRIETATPPGSNGETVFYDVLRKMLPESGGETLSVDNLTQEKQYQYQTSVNPAWNISEITTIVYIQNNTTREVYQAASAE